MKQKWLAVVGSSRQGANTDKLVDYMLEAIQDTQRDVFKVFLPNEGIVTCDGCEACLTTGTCRIKDSLSGIISMMDEYEGVIFASPTYNYDMSAQMKAFLDRTFYLGFKRRLNPESQKQKAIILSVCRGTAKESMGNTVEGISNVAKELEMEVIDVIEYYNTKQYPVSANQMIKDIVQQRVLNLMEDHYNHGY